MSISATKCKPPTTPPTNTHYRHSSTTSLSLAHSTSAVSAAETQDNEEHNFASPTEPHAGATTAAGAQHSHLPPPPSRFRVGAPWTGPTQSLYTTSPAALSHTGGYSSKQQRHTQTAPSAAATTRTRTHRCHRFRRFLQNLFKLKQKTPQNNSTPNHLRTDTRPAPQSRRQWQARHDTRHREPIGSKPTLYSPARRADTNTTFKPLHGTTSAALSGTPQACWKQPSYTP